MDELDRAIADGETQGFVKVLTAPGKDRILGVTIVGEHAGDLIAEYVLAMKHKLGLNKVLGTIHIYPTMAEANKYVAGNWKRAHAPQRLLGLGGKISRVAARLILCRRRQSAVIATAKTSRTTAPRGLSMNPSIVQRAEPASIHRCGSLAARRHAVGPGAALAAFDHRHAAWTALLKDQVSWQRRAFVHGQVRCAQAAARSARRLPEKPVGSDAAPNTTAGTSRSGSRF